MIRVTHEFISTRCACRSSWGKLLMWSSLFLKNKNKNKIEEKCK